MWARELDQQDLRELPLPEMVFRVLTSLWYTGLLDTVSTEHLTWYALEPDVVNFDLVLHLRWTILWYSTYGMRFLPSTLARPDHLVLYITVIRTWYPIISSQRNSHGPYGAYLSLTHPIDVCLTHMNWRWLKVRWYLLSSLLADLPNLVAISLHDGESSRTIPLNRNYSHCCLRVPLHCYANRKLLPPAASYSVPLSTGSSQGVHFCVRPLPSHDVMYSWKNSW